MTPLQKEFDRLGITPTSAAKETGLPQPVIQRWYRGTRPITKAGALTLAPLVGKTPEYLMFADRTVPIVGKVGASNEINYYSESSGYMGLARFPDQGTDETVAVEIDGDSLGAAWNGWIAYYDDRHEPPLPSMMRELCVVGLDTGAVLVKRLMPGRGEGLFDLWPGDGIGDPLEDQPVRWAALVMSVVRPQYAKIEESQEEPSPEPAGRPHKKRKSNSRPRVAR